MLWIFFLSSGENEAAISTRTNFPMEYLRDYRPKHQNNQQLYLQDIWWRNIQPDATSKDGWDSKVCVNPANKAVFTFKSNCEKEFARLLGLTTAASSFLRLVGAGCMFLLPVVIGSLSYFHVVVIGPSDYFGFGFTTLSHWKTALIWTLS